MQRNRPSRPGKRWALIAAVVACGMVSVGAVGLAAVMREDGPGGSDRVQAIIERTLPTDGCLRSTELSSRVSAALATSGIHDWTVDPSGVKPNDCVAPFVNASSRTVFMMPGLGADLATAMAGVADALMDHCLDLADAKALVTTLLRESGRENIGIRTDGPIAYPSDRRDEVLRHVAQGCVIYSGAGTDANGDPVIYLGVAAQK